MNDVKNTVKKLLYIILGMFCFSFALIPFYDAFCKITGINGKIDISQGTLSRYKVDKSEIPNRLITVELDANQNRTLPCEFAPNTTAIQIQPGVLTLITYTVKNLSNRKMIIQAIPSVSPGIAAKHLKKLECFCFNRQVLKPFETASLPIRFWLEPEIPDSIHRLTLSYTIFDVTTSRKENAL